MKVTLRWLEESVVLVVCKKSWLLFEWTEDRSVWIWIRAFCSTRPAYEETIESVLEGPSSSFLFETQLRDTYHGQDNCKEPAGSYYRAMPIRDCTCVKDQITFLQLCCCSSATTADEKHQLDHDVQLSCLAYDQIASIQIGLFSSLSCQ